MHSGNKYLPILAWKKHAISHKHSVVLLWKKISQHIFSKNLEGGLVESVVFPIGWTKIYGILFAKSSWLPQKKKLWKSKSSLIAYWRSVPHPPACRHGRNFRGAESYINYCLSLLSSPIAMPGPISLSWTLVQDMEMCIDYEFLKCLSKSPCPLNI